MQSAKLIVTASIIAAAAMGCGDDEETSSSTGGSGGMGGQLTGGTAGEASGGAGGGSGGGGAGTGGGAGLFHITFDYRFDTKGAFQDPARRASLEAAAAEWEQLIEEDFEDIPAGTEVLVRDPELPTEPGQVFVMDEPIDDLVVFVGVASMDGPGGQLAESFPSAAIGSVSDPTLSAKLAERNEGPDFEPWTAWLSFDETESWYYDETPETGDDIPAAQIDFMSVAMHELGHILGFGSADAYFALVDGQSQFIGEAAMAAYSGPVPLTSNAYHLDPSVMSDGGRPLMDPSDASGQRSVITSLERALFSDLGHQITP